LAQILKGSLSIESACRRQSICPSAVVPNPEKSGGRDANQNQTHGCFVGRFHSVLRLAHVCEIRVG
jgi:hypothetical protein